MTFHKTSIYVTGFLFLTPTMALAVYEPLVNIPGVSNPQDTNAYINALYALSISLAALLAVIKIIIAGAKYMLSDVVTDKSEAKEDIKGALLGLLLIVSAVLILTTINPNLTNLTILQGAPRVSVPTREGTALTPEQRQRNYIEGIRERCERAGSTFVPPSTLYRNGRCLLPGFAPRTTATPQQPPNCNTLQGASGQNCLELLTEVVNGVCASGFTLQPSSSGPGCVRTSYDPQGNPCNPAYQTQNGLCVIYEE